MSVVELLRQSWKQAESATRSVRAAAKLRIARVEAATDPAKGRITLEMALEEIGVLPEPERTVLFDHARVFAAAVEPSLLPGIPEESSVPQGHAGWMMGKTMLEHGHTDAALQFVLQDRPAEAFPFLFAMNILHECEDQAQRLAVMRKAVMAWYETREREFLKLFGRYWTVLPTSEALSVLHSVIESTLNEPEWPMQGSFDNGLLLFTSGREFTLFEVLHILRRLDSTLAAELISAHEQLATSSRRYPNGWDSIQQEAEEEQKRRGLKGGSVGGGRGYIGSGASRDIDFQFAMQDGDFDSAMKLAQELYREDTDIEAPNFAPKVLWPSAARFRSVLYHAGKRMGLEKQNLLTRVPDGECLLLRIRVNPTFTLGLALSVKTSTPMRRETGKEQRLRVPAHASCTLLRRLCPGRSTDTMVPRLRSGTPFSAPSASASSRSCRRGRSDRMKLSPS